MRLVIHQALKDVRSLRWMLVVWLALLATFRIVAVLGVGVPPGQFTGDNLLTSAYTAILAMMVGAFVVIPALVMQNDPAVGTTAFWFTRPISRPVLIAGKLLVAMSAFVVLPVLVDAITLLAAGVELPGVLATAAEALAVQAVWLLPVMALAAMTTSLAQFVLAALLEIISFLALVTLARLRGPVFFAVSWEMVTIVYMTALLVAAIVLIVAAYWSRDMKRATVVAIAAPVFVLGAMMSWKWELPPSWPFAPGTQVGIVAKAGRTWVMPDGDVAISVDLSLSGLSPGQRLRIAVEDAWLQYGKERVNVNVRGNVNARGESSRDLSASTTTIFPVVLWRSVQHRVNDPAVFHAILRVGTIDQREATVAISPGATYQLGIGRGEIMRVRVEEPPRIVVTLRETGLDERSQPGERLEYLLRNPRTGDMWWFGGLADVPSPFVALFFLPVSQHLVANWHSFTVMPPARFVKPTAAENAEWLRESKLVIIESRQTGSFLRHVEIPNLVLSSLLKGGA